MINKLWSSKFWSISQQLIDIFDVFGQLPNFRVLKKAKHTSTAGFILSLVSMTILLTYLTTEVISMLQKSQPSMIASEELIFDTSPFQLKNDNFTLALSVADINNDAIEGINKYYTMEIKQCERRRIEDPSSGNITIELNCTNLPYETCNTTHFITDLQKNYFKRIKLGSIQCINRKYLDETPPVLQGQLNAMVFKYILVYLRICKNTTELQTCASPEEIASKLSSAQYNIYSSDYLLQLNRAAEPLEQIITPYFSSFSVTTSKKIIQYYNLIETISDDGVLFEKNQVQENVKKGQIEPYSELYNGKYLIQHYIAISSVKTNYMRSYIKLQTILAKLGGIWQIFILIISIAFKGVLYDLMLLKVSSKLFSFQGINDNNQTQPIQNNQLAFDNSFISQIKIIFGVDKKNKKQFQFAKEEIMKSLDIVKIIKKLQRLDMLIDLLLNQNQQTAFLAVSKPKISTSIEDKFKNKKLETQSNFESYQHTHCNEQDQVRTKNLCHISTYLKDQKDFSGFEKEINQKLLLYLERHNQKIIRNELQSPQNYEWSFRIHDSVEDIIEPKAQEPK